MLALFSKVTLRSQSKVWMYASQQCSSSVSSKKADVDLEDGKDKPIKFTVSKAHKGYVARHNFNYTSEDAGLPRSNNIVLAGSVLSFLLYFCILREENDFDLKLDFSRPVYETLPHLAIPMLQAAIKENQRFGKDTKKLEAKLAEYMVNPEKHGGFVRKPVMN